MDSENGTDVAMLPSEHTEQFMLAEYQALQERARHYEQIAENRTNYYLAVTTALVTAMVFIYSSQDLRSIFIYAAPLLTTVWFAIGASSLIQVYNFHVLSTLMHRRAGRVRRWFLDGNPRILPYLPFEAVDDQPLFVKGEGSLRFIDVVLVIVTVCAFLACVASVVLMISQLSRSNLLYFLGLFLIFVLSLNVVAALTRKDFRRQETNQLKKGHVHFPSLQAQPLSNERKNGEVKPPDNQATTVEQAVNQPEQSSDEELPPPS
jgi:hypothetical protein